ncbi:hypothetical protein F4604DRAFT_1680129 [Suillus subluteus]|nr:hypothetical protein F4604DRAFT_1680129 [Suillus subluteus]
MDQHPTKNELLTTITEIEEHGDYTHRQICDLVTAKYPNCIISIKIRIEAKTTACITVTISNHMTLSTSVTQGLLLLLANLLPVKQIRLKTDLEALQIVGRLLPAGVPQEPLVLFPKDKHITHWYYHIYFTSTTANNRALHPVLREIFGRKCPQGEVVIVKTVKDLQQTHQHLTWTVRNLERHYGGTSRAAEIQ